jgi:hypothetical protein
VPESDGVQAKTRSGAALLLAQLPVSEPLPAVVPRKVPPADGIAIAPAQPPTSGPGVEVGVAAGVVVRVGVTVGAGVAVAVRVGVVVGTGVAVRVGVAVRIGVAVRVGVGVRTGVAVGNGVPLPLAKSAT